MEIKGIGSVTGGWRNTIQPRHWNKTARGFSWERSESLFCLYYYVKVNSITKNEKCSFDNA
jgi:hypothetical protein